MRFFNALIVGAIYALTFWGFSSLLGYWDYAAHHITDQVLLVGVVAAFGSWSGWNSAKVWRR